MEFWKTQTLNVYDHEVAVKDDQGNELSYGELRQLLHLFEVLPEFRSIVLILVSVPYASYENDIAVGRIASDSSNDSLDYSASKDNNSTVGYNASTGNKGFNGSLATLIGYLSCIRNRHIPLMISEKISADRVIEYITQYGINAIWMSERKKKELDSACRKRQILFEKSICSYGEYVLYQISEIPVPVHDELALLLTTSGSTGTGKLVRISYKNLQSNTENIVRSLGITEQDMAVVSLPLYYTYGLSVINTHLYRNATLFITKTAPYTSQFWKICDKNQVTTFAGVPYTYELLRKMGFHHMELSSLKTLTVAGGRLGEKEEQYYTEYALNTHKSFFVMYGQTEATARISCRACHSMNQKTGSVGLPIPEGEIWIESRDGRRCSESYATGEVIYRGNNVSMGYAYSKDDFVKGYDWGDILHTGDTGYQDDEGYLYLIGRKDRMVKVNGIRVDLQELEKMLKEEYQQYDFRCEVEKCAGIQMVHKIRVQVYIGNDQKKSMELAEEHVENRMENHKENHIENRIKNHIESYLVEKTGFGGKHFHVIVEE